MSVASGSALRARASSRSAPIIVLVEDEAGIRQFVRTALESAGYSVFEGETLARGRIAVSIRRPDVVVLDLGLPDGDGMTLLAELRDWSHVPVLVLSARGDETDKVRALNAGADDYLSKPFGVAELLARVRALLRRSQRVAEGAKVHFGDIEVDLECRSVRRAGADVHLTPTEFKLLGLLLQAGGKILTQRQLLAGVWGPNHVEHAHYLRVYMAGLRRKLEVDPARPCHILTESGVGYRLLR